MSMQENSFLSISTLFVKIKLGCSDDLAQLQNFPKTMTAVNYRFEQLYVTAAII